MSNKLSSRPSQGKLFIVSAPGGTGKTTLCNMLLKKLPKVKRSISYTTRSPRRGEKHSHDYHFVDVETFLEMKKKDAFLESTKVFGNYYGTEKKSVFSALNQGYHVILVIDVVGAKKIKKLVKDAIMIFILPPSLAELKRRLEGRNTDSERSITKRLTEAKEEMSHADLYDYQVVNKDLNKAFDQLKAIFIIEESKVTKRT